jgi:hypothetical protein
MRGVASGTCSGSSAGRGGGEVGVGAGGGAGARVAQPAAKTSATRPNTPRSGFDLSIDIEVEGSSGYHRPRMKTRLVAVMLLAALAAHASANDDPR